MKIAIMQPYFIPYISYWQLISLTDTFVIFDDVNFKKKSYINRNNILSGNKSFQITLELQGASQNKLINDIKIGDNLQKLLKSIYINYKKAPFFEIVFPVIQDIFTQNEKKLSNFLGYSLINLCKYMGINSKIIYSSEIDKDNSLRAQEKIISICKKLKATNYINAINGKNLYNYDKFIENKIKLNFIETNFFEYNQFNNNFIPYLSIVDIMMFNDKDQINNMLQNYKLI